MKEIRSASMRLERWVNAQHCLPSFEQVFRPAALQSEIDAAEAVLGRALPDAYRAFLLLHDGQASDGADPLRWLPQGMHSLGIRETVALWREERVLERDHCDAVVDEPTTLCPEGEAVRELPTVTAPERVPIAEHEGISVMYLDFVPGAAGVPGQVIFTRDECSYSWAGQDFAEFLDTYIGLLEQQVLRFDAEVCGQVVPADPALRWDDLLGRRI